MSIFQLALAWTLLALAGLVVHGMGLGDAVSDRHILKESKTNGRRAIVANEKVRNHISRIYVKVTFVAIGLAAMAHSPYAGLITTFGLMSASLVMLINSLMDRRDRGILLRWYRETARRVNEQ